MKRIPTLKPSFYVVSMLRKEKPPLDASGYKKKLILIFFIGLYMSLDTTRLVFHQHRVACFQDLASVHGLI